jgi:hypothetical protein
VNVYAPTIATLKFSNVAMLVGRRSAIGLGVVAKHNCVSKVYYFTTDNHTLLWINIVMVNSVIKKERNYSGSIPIYSPFAMANCGGPLICRI